MNVTCLLWFLRSCSALTVSVFEDDVPAFNEDEFHFLLESILAEPGITRWPLVGLFIEIFAYSREDESLPEKKFKTISLENQRSLAQLIFQQKLGGYLPYFSPFIDFDKKFIQRCGMEVPLETQMTFLLNPKIGWDLKLSWLCNLIPVVEDLGSHVIKLILMETRVPKFEQERLEAVRALGARNGQTGPLFEDLLGVWLECYDSSIIIDSDRNGLLDTLIEEPQNLMQAIWKHGLEPYLNRIHFPPSFSFEIKSLLAWDTPRAMNVSPSKYLKLWLDDPRMARLDDGQEVLQGFFHAILTDDSRSLPQFIRSISPEVMAMVHWPFILPQTSDLRLLQLLGMELYGKATFWIAEIEQRRNLAVQGQRQTSNALDGLVFLLHPRPVDTQYIAVALQQRPDAVSIWRLIKYRFAKALTLELVSLLKEVRIPKESLEVVYSYLLRGFNSHVAGLIDLIHHKNPVPFELNSEVCQQAGRVLAHDVNVLSNLVALTPFLNNKERANLVIRGYQKERKSMQLGVDHSVLDNVPNLIN